MSTSLPPFGHYTGSRKPVGSKILNMIPTTSSSALPAVESKTLSGLRVVWTKSGTWSLVFRSTLSFCGSLALELLGPALFLLWPPLYLEVAGPKKQGNHSISLYHEQQQQHRCCCCQDHFNSIIRSPIQLNSNSRIQILNTVISIICWSHAIYPVALSSCSQHCSVTWALLRLCVLQRMSRLKCLIDSFFLRPKRTLYAALRLTQDTYLIV